MLKPLLNRAADGTFQLPADGMYHLIPKGEFPHPESKTVQILDDKALTAIADRFNAESQTPRFPGLRVDYDHFSYDDDKSSEAAGWIKKLEPRADGIYANVQWTPQGEAALKDGRFRLASPVWLPHQVEKLGSGRIRPLRLDSAGLTNNPNLRGMVPLSNRAGSGESADTQPDRYSTNKNTMKSIATKLGLSAEASEDSILSAVTTLSNRATAAEEALTPLKNRNTTLETEKKELLTAQVETDLAKYANRIKPEAKEKIRAALLANRAGTIDILEGMEEIKPAAATRGNATGQFNRASGQQPGNAAAAAGATDEEAKARKLREATEDYRIANRCTFGEAWDAVRRKSPELFAA